MNNKRTIPRGIRNNNPLNIRIGNKWKGEVENPTDKDFEQFTSIIYGLRAAFILLIRYICRYKLKNLHSIISRWAPPSENHTSKYETFVSQHADIGILDNIDYKDKATMCKIVHAMCHFENGMDVSMSHIMEGYDLAMMSR